VRSSNTTPFASDSASTIGATPLDTSSTRKNAPLEIPKPF